MKTAILASLIAAASAFAPAKQGQAASALSASSPYENELGVIAPTGFFDPFGLSSKIDQATFDQYRAAELKHGRVAMLAVLGYVVPEISRAHYEFIPGGVSTDNIPNGVAALAEIPALGLAQIIFFIGAVDYWGYLGNFEVGKLNLPAEVLERRKLSELQHGRIAMLGFLELLRHDSQNYVEPGFDGMDKLITGLPFLY